MQAGAFVQFRDVAPQDYKDLTGRDFDWLALNGSRHKAPLGGRKTRPNPKDCGKGGTQFGLAADRAAIARAQRRHKAQLEIKFDEAEKVCSFFDFAKAKVNKLGKVKVVVSPTLG